VVEWRRADRVLPLPPVRRERRLVGVVRVEGAIVAGPSRRSPVPLPLIGGSQAGSDSIIKALRQAERDRRVAAVVLHIDSPGGDAFASDLIWREALRLSRSKPLVVSMGDVAASGGYYVAAPARKIVAQRATMTGSIGVIMAKAVTTGAYEKLDARWDTVQRGAHADLYSGLSAWEGDKRTAVEQSLQHVYQEFKQRVAEGRSIPLERLDDLAGGRVWTGEQALAHGLVDALGDFDTAVEAACAAASLPTDGSVPTVTVSEPSRPLLAEPIKGAEALLGLMLRSQALLWADGAPRVRG
jgi:protease-4